jgi:hypothetical protein
VAGELRIVVDEAIELYVVDVIEFDDRARVTAIRSYCGVRTSQDSAPRAA